MSGLYKHSKNVAKLCEKFSKYLGKTEPFIDLMVQAGLYHDIGKVKINQDILNKKGGLTIEEWNHIKKHVIYSRILVNRISDNQELINIVAQHHEEDSGKGYPRGLEGHKIDEGAKILKICDTYISLREKRPYREGFSVDKTFEVMDDMSEKMQINKEIYIKFKGMVLEYNTFQAVVGE